MGGGPRTFPGGVTKWQWKRMQEKKKKERDKIWLAKERSLYERRRRAQIMALMPVRPWEKLHPDSPSLPKIDKDPKIGEMARRFQKDYGIDLWNKNDGVETCTSLIKLDQEGLAPKQPVLKPFHPLTLSVSRRVTDPPDSPHGKPPRGPYRQAGRPYRRDETPEIFQHSRFMLASYLRKQGHMGLGFTEEAITPPVVNHEVSSNERTEYSSWLSALASDRTRLSERQHGNAPKKK